jgi:hypothetical protein
LTPSEREPLQEVVQLKIVVDEKVGTGKVNGVNPVGTEPFLFALIEQVNLLMKVLGETKFNMNTDDIQTKYDHCKASVDTTDQAELIADINNLINTIMSI